MVDPLKSNLATSGAEARYPLLVIVGPTASGKSALAMALAERWDGEIVNYDSMQLYRGFNIGTGKLSPEERRAVPHHLLDCVDPGQVFTAGDFAREASRALTSIRERGRLPILAGGTGLYLRALLVGLFEGPKRSAPLRARLSAMAGRHGCEFLHRLLCRLDSETGARIQPRDAQKMIRAIEVCLLAKQPFSSLLASGRKGLQGFRPVKIGLNPDRAELDHRINARVEKMFAAGLMDEARALFESRSSLQLKDSSRQGPYASLGYPQAMAAVCGTISKQDAILETQTATRRYAKRQRTWFRREEGVAWFADFGDDPTIQNAIFDYLTGEGFPAIPQAREARVTAQTSSARAL